MRKRRRFWAILSASGPLHGRPSLGPGKMLGTVRFGRLGKRRAKHNVPVLGALHHDSLAPATAYIAPSPAPFPAPGVMLGPVL